MPSSLFHRASVHMMVTLLINNVCIVYGESFCDAADGQRRRMDSSQVALQDVTENHFA